MTPETHIADRSTGTRCESFEVRGPLFCPYYNIWGQNVYEQYGAFQHNPFLVPASSTSGSPVVIDADGKFFGFTNDQAVAGAEFIYDGNRRLTVNIPAGQALWGDGSGADDSWKRYNSLVLSELPRTSVIRDFWCDVEYCTWVEQKAVAQERGCSPFEVMSHDFIARYMEQIDRMGLPKGKLTIDHGWQFGDETYGDWVPHPERFPDLAKTAELIESNGFTPSLWMSPIWFHPKSAIIRQHPEWLGSKIAPATPDSPQVGDWYYFKPLAEVEVHLNTIFRRFHDMGFRKFKFDMIYAEKQLMKQLHQLIYRAVKQVSDDIEVEIHQPDIFFTTCCDAVRTNDILCNDDFPWWSELTKKHMEVCEKSAAGRVINLDHIGGNDPSLSEETFLKHLDLYRGAVGHPVVSLLPERLGEKASVGLADYLKDFNSKRTAVSFYQAASTVSK